MLTQRRADGSLHLPWICLLISLALGLGGCASGAFNSDPACKDCDRFLGEHKDYELASDPCERKIPEVQTDRQFKNLVFEGGGVKGAAYVGALEVMDKAELLDGVEQVAGTSAGAITASMVALGVEPEEIRKLMLDLNFENFEDGSCLLGNTSRLVNRYGWYKGDFFLCFLECLVHRQMQHRDATFADLADKIKHPKSGDPPFRELFVIGTDVTTNNTQVFSAETTPGMRIADAVRISMSIPLFFAAREANIGNEVDVFVDGGVLRNYPIDLFDAHITLGMMAESAPADTLGFHLGTLPQDRHKTNDLIAFSLQVAATLLNQQVVSLCNGSRVRDVERSVFIPTLGVGTTDFDISRKKKCELANSGASATAEYLKLPEPQTQCPIWLLEILQTHLPPQFPG